MGTEEITRRLKRVEGQIRGLQRMVEDGRDCEAIITQLMAARSALDQVGLLIADNFVQECLTDTKGAVARDRISRVLDLILSRFSVPAQSEGTAPAYLDESGKEEQLDGKADRSHR